MKPLAWALLGASLAAVLVTGVRCGMIGRRAAAVEDELAASRRRLSELAPVVASTERFERLRHRATVRTEVIDGLRRHTILSGSLLAGLRAAAPASLLIDRVATEGATVEISGRADPGSAATRWSEELQRQGILEAVAVTFDREDGGGAGEFTLRGRLGPPAELGAAR